MREQVQAKLSRLPLSYFDRQPRGEILSRVTNDIDNLAQSLQQTLSQLVTSLLTIVGVLAMMFWISWLLALIALVTVPVSVVDREPGSASAPSRSSSGSGRRPAGSTATSRRLHRSLAGQGVRPAGGGRWRPSPSRTRSSYQASFRAQFISGTIQPAMMFVGNLNYVLVAVVGALRVAAGALSLGDVQAFIQYSRQFSQPLTQVASMANLLQSGVASAERVFALLDADEQEPDPAQPGRAGGGRRPGAVRARLVPVRARPAADRGPVAGGRARPDGGDRRADGRRQDHAGQPADAVLRGRLAAAITARRRRHRRR